MLRANCFYTCIPLTEKKETGILKEIDKAASQKPDFLEWRRDYFQNDCFELETRIVNTIKSKVSGLIYTFRAQEEGGVCTTDNKKRLEHIKNALKSKCVDCIDIELNSEKTFKEAVIQITKEHESSLILSHHNFEKTYSTEKILELLNTMDQNGADILKLAVSAKCKEDIFSLITGASLFRRQCNKPMILIAMGKLGKLTRIFPDTFGGGLTYATGVQMTAPGQVTIDEINKIRGSFNF